MHHSPLKRAISKIVEVENKEMPESNDFWGEADGYEVHLNTGEVLGIYISNSQNCCECFGHVCSEDNFSDFIGADFLGYDIVDMDLAVKHDKLFDTKDYDRLTDGVHKMLRQWRNSYRLGFVSLSAARRRARRGHRQLPGLRWSRAF